MAETAPTPDRFDLEVETLILGAGAGGMVAALAAQEAGQEVLVLEADTVPSGSSALSAGLIPAAGTRFQRAAGIDDDPALFASDIQRKAQGENDPALVEAMTNEAAPAIDWLADRFGLPFSVIDDFCYPGHSRKRMHGLPSRSGAELVDRLRSTCEAQDIDLICDRRGTVLHHNGPHVTGLTVARPDGGAETIGCQKLILACNGFGGNRAMVAKHMPQIADALWFGHDGNRGEAVLWANAIGARTRNLGAFQGHGNVAHPHGILITWATITEGGIQVNRNGARFWDESQGYSEAARAVLAQPGGDACTIFDARIAAIARQFDDFKQAEAQGAIRQADTLAALADMLDLPKTALAKEFDAIPDSAPDRFGRVFSGQKLRAPFFGARVTGALFHTQGGIETDGTGRALSSSGAVLPNLFAVGGAACGVSGRGDSGYLSGNGLLSAVTLGRRAGLA